MLNKIEAKKPFVQVLLVQDKMLPTDASSNLIVSAMLALELESYLLIY